MNIALSSIKRPIFIVSITVLLFVLGFISYKSMGIDLFPDADFPVVLITIIYPGAAPDEIENLISKPIEAEISSIGGLKTLTSNNLEGVSIITAEFSVGTDFKYAEQQIRDKMTIIRPKLPADIMEPTYKRFSMASLPIMRFSIEADLTPNKLYDLANETIKSQIEQVPNVGGVTIVGGRRREIQVELDRDKLNQYRLSASQVAGQLRSSGINVPIGKHEKGTTETVYRAVGEFERLDEIGNAVVQFSGDVSSSVSVKDLGTVRDGAEDPTTLGFLYYPFKEASTIKKGFFDKHFSGKKTADSKIKDTKVRSALFFDIYKQTGSNTVAVADNVRAKVDLINARVNNLEGKPRMILLQDTSDIIRANVEDVQFTIIIGIILAVFVVYMFLGSFRSTIITGIALPTSLIGGFIFMYLMNFTMNLMSLMALSLAVGLLIDDAVVIQENIFRKREQGLSPFKAAEMGTREVQLAVLATTLTVIAVFGPIGFLQGSIGVFFRQFGFTVVFAMIISYFCAMTIAPLLNAYFSGKPQKKKNKLIAWFDRVQDKIDFFYEAALDFSLRRPGIVIGSTMLIFLLSCVLISFVPKAFQPENDSGEFLVNLELPTSISLDGTKDVTMSAFEKLKIIPQVRYITIAVGNDRGETNKAQFTVKCYDRSERRETTTEIKQIVRDALKEFAFAKPSVSDSSGGGGGRPYYQLNIMGDDMDALIAYSQKAMEALKKVSDITEISSNYAPGKPEFQVQLDPLKMEALGVSPRSVGAELRTYISGADVGTLHQDGLEYNINLRIREDQRNLKDSYHLIRVPNTQNKMIPLSAISTTKETVGPSQIMRQDKSRVIQIGANLAPGGAIGNATQKTNQILTKDLPAPKGITFKLVGQAESFKELMTNIIIAFCLSILFIYLVLSSLYDSFITPLTILTALPPALTGAFVALFISRQNFDMFSMIGIVALLGLVTKNAILLVDFALEGQRAGMTQKEAIKRAGMVRLRPILMTSLAIVAGMIPLAAGLGEAASYRKAMGIAIIGGVIFSTFITLLVVPAIFESVDKLRIAIEKLLLPPDIIAASIEINRKDAEEIMGNAAAPHCKESFSVAVKAAAKSTIKKISPVKKGK